MSKFNKRSVRKYGSGPIQTVPDDYATTHEGGVGFARDPKSELFLLAVTNLVGENTFYEKGDQRDARFITLIRQTAAADPAWFGAFVPWLRSEANMRSAPLVAALEGARVWRANGIKGGRRLVDSALQRPDEPGEAVAYWLDNHGRRIPKPIKRGIADAVARLYNEYAVGKYDTDSAAVRFGDVIDLTHPKTAHAWQGSLYRHCLDRRHGRDEVIPAPLEMLRKRRALFALPVSQRRSHMTTQALREAGVTWEQVAGWLQGPLDAQAWELLIPTMGYMALLRNLRNFDQAGVSDITARQVADRLRDPAQVARSRQFPIRFYSAYKNTHSLRWGQALEEALNLSLSNVPELPGRTLILVDRSGSMFGGLSERSQLNRADMAAVFGAALSLRCAQPTLVQYGTGSEVIPVRRGYSVLGLISKFGNLGGTQTTQAVKQHWSGHDRVVIVTDEQAHYSYYGDPGQVVPTQVPIYTWNLAGYKHGHTGGENRHTFGGLTDAAFRMVPLIEAGKAANWPFSNEEDYELWPSPTALG